MLWKVTISNTQFQFHAQSPLHVFVCLSLHLCPSFFLSVCLRGRLTLYTFWCIDWIERNTIWLLLAKGQTWISCQLNSFGHWQAKQKKNKNTYLIMWPAWSTLLAKKRKNKSLYFCRAPNDSWNVICICGYYNEGLMRSFKNLPVNYFIRLKLRFWLT